KLSTASWPVLSLKAAAISFAGSVKLAATATWTSPASAGPPNTAARKRARTAGFVFIGGGLRAGGGCHPRRALYSDVYNAPAGCREAPAVLSSPRNGWPPAWGRGRSRWSATNRETRRAATHSARH